MCFNHVLVESKQVGVAEHSRMRAAASHNRWHVCVFAEEVCVEEMKACAADKECSMLNAKLRHYYKLQQTKKDEGYGGKGGDGKQGGYGGKGGDDNGDDKKPKENGQDGEKKGSESYGGKGGDSGYGDKKPKQHGGQDGKYQGKGGFGKKRRQLDGHEKTSEKDGEEETSMDKKDMGGKGGEEKEPSAELKAAMKACTENELCNKLMECNTKHKESGGKGDGKGDDSKLCMCPKIHKPVCGKDGKTYANGCVAKCKNMEYANERCQDTGNGGSGSSGSAWICIKACVCIHRLIES